MIKPYRVYTKQFILPHYYRFHYKLYRGDIHKRYAKQLIKTVDIKKRYAYHIQYASNKNKRYGAIQSWQYDYSTTGHISWSPIEEYRNKSSVLISVNEVSNNIYEVIEYETPETKIIIPT